MVAIQRQFQEMQAQLQRLEQENVELRRQQPQRETLSSVLTPSSSTPQPAQSTKKKLPDPPKFSGTRSEWVGWELRVNAKLGVDKPQDTHLERFYYVNTLLEGDASRNVQAWVRTVQGTAGATAEALLTKLGMIYADPNAKQRAATRLSSLRQDNQYFSTHFPKFEHALTDAGGYDWPDEVKITFLRSTLNNTIKGALVGKDIPTTFPEYCELLFRIGDQLRELQPSSKSRNRGT